VGTRADIELAHKGASTRVVDLAGRTLAPGFIDGHAHMLGFGAQSVGANLLASPDGTVNTIDELVVRLQEFAKGPDVARTGWIFGVGYDDTLLGRHPTRDDLDKVSMDVPVIAVHISGHFSAMNSAGLAKVGLTAESVDPEGGIIRRREGSREPNGVLEEMASFPYMIPAVNPTKPEDMDYFLTRGLELAKSFGFTTAYEGRAFAFQHEQLLDAAKRGLLDIDVVSQIDYSDRRVIPTPVTTTYDNRYRVAGIKITLDGSVPGRTAWLTQPYLIPPEGQNADYAGYPAFPDTKVVQELIDEGYAKGWPVHVHANGDAAVDQLIAALSPVHQKYPAADRRTTMIHGVAMRRDQLGPLKDMQVIASLFPMHTYYWGDFYQTTLGPDRANSIAPIGTALRMGMHVNSHSDAPVALPNLMQVMWATVNRTSRSGEVIGADERLTPIEGLKAITLWPAYEIFEEKTKGSIEPGKLADLVVLSDNPLTIDPMKINSIVVLETIKEGKTVYTRP
jgi:predicted amidohydrolase YtcJ